MTGELVLTVEIVTPIFLGGSSAKALAETVRPASIRGQVRYWLRALLARSSRSLMELQREEGAVMGDTQAGSPVRFRVRSAVPLKCVEKPAPRQNGGRMILPHRAIQDRDNPLREAAFLEGQQFDILLSPRPGRSRVPDEVAAATLLWLYLGGLGKRARRGFGSLNLIRCTGTGVVDEAAKTHLVAGPPPDAKTLRLRIEDLFNWAEKLAPVAKPIDPPAPFSILDQDAAGVRVSDAVTGYNLTGYHQAMVPFWRESLRADDRYDNRAYGYVDPGARDPDPKRRASPFHLHIARTDEGYHQVITTFWAEPSPDGDAGWAKVSDLLADVETRFGAANLWGRAL